MSILANRTVVSAVSLVVAIAFAGCGPETPVASRSPIVGNTSPPPIEPGRTDDPTATDPPTITDAPAAMPPALFGAFQRSPLTVPLDLLGDAEGLCRTKPVPAYAEEIGARPLVVSDTRGLGMLILVFADAAGATGCRIDADQAGGMRASHFAVSAEPDGALERGAVTLGALQYPGEGLSQRTIAVGRVGEGAARVRAAFPDDTSVTAAMANGWYAVWWPGGARPSRILAEDDTNAPMGTVTPP